MMFLLIPILIALVVVFGLVSLTAGLFSLVGAGWPWLLIGLGVFMFWHEDGRHHRHSRHQRRWAKRHAWQAVEPTSGPWATTAVADQRPSAPADPPPAKNEPTPIRQQELPIDVKVKVEQIRHKVDVLLGYADRFPPFSQDLYLVRQTAADYLPRTLETYQAMPLETAERPMADGRTPHQELRAQLDLLDTKLDDITQDLQRQDTDRLLANRRFLEDRFGMRDGAKDDDIAV